MIDIIKQKMGSNSSETYDNLINSPAADDNNFRMIIPHLSFRTINLNNGLISVLTPVLPNYFETFNSEDSAILRERANLFAVERKFNEALVNLNKLLKMEPNDPEALVNRGIVYFNLDKYEEALSDLNRSLEIESNNALALKFRGEIYNKLGNYEEALSDLNKSLSIEPDSAGKILYATKSG